MITVKRLSSLVALGLGLGLLASASAHAGDCSAQTGKTIFEDTFKDDSGGFEQDDQAKFGVPGLRMTLAKTEDGWPYVNNGFNATNGDYCAVAIMPAAVAADNLAAVGITLFYVDDENMVAIYVYSDNTVQVERRAKGDSDLVLSEQNTAIMSSAGAPVSVRAVVEDGAITPYVNGVAFKKIRVQVPDGADRFGLYVALDKVANKEVPFEFNSFRVTALPDSKK